jgi:hypothetical protein
MPDNVGYTPGSGAVVAADDINGILYQRIKPSFGGDGQATDVSVSNPMPIVDDRNNQLLSLLQRLVKIMESNQVVDSAQRQRIRIDDITGGLTLATVSTVTGVTTVSTVTTVTGVTNISQIAGMDREQYINIARQTYAETIRNKLNFS